MDCKLSAEEVFSLAIAKSTEAERAALVNEACQGNDSLRLQVVDLLSAFADMGQFLERPIAEVEAFSTMSPDRDDVLSFLDPPMEPESLGKLDHYEILEVIGQGGMGIVLRAKDTKLSRHVAIKILASPLAVSERARKWFAREARAAAAIRDDHVVAIYAVRDDAKIPFQVMELIEGGNLTEYIRSRGPLEVKCILEIGIQIASGLAAAHRQGLIHRDIKPANILVDSRLDRMKLTDFGLARAVDDASVSQIDFVAGTPMYMAPEQASNSPIDHRADLFSLGSVLYELCTGKSAFGAPTAIAAIKRVCDESTLPIRQLRPEIPEQLCELIDRMHAKDPADRPESALEIANRLQELLQDFKSQRTVSMARTSSSSNTEGSRAAVLLTERPFAFSPSTVLRILLATSAIAFLFCGLGLILYRTWPSDQVLPARNISLGRKPTLNESNDAESVEIASKTNTETKGFGSSGIVDDATWEESVATLPAKELVDAVTLRLKELNPNFDGVVDSTIRDGAVVRMTFLSDQVATISPLRAMKMLEDVECNGTYPRNGKISDLSPLKGMKLQSLKCNSTLVQDLSPLRGMPLKTLICGETLISDLEPLQGMPLDCLAMQRTNVSDLTPLKGMPLTFLDMYLSDRVRDLSPLEGMQLRYLNLSSLRIDDITPLAKMNSLRQLILESVPVSDFTAIQNLNIEVLCIRGIASADLSLLAKLPLKQIRLDYTKECDKFLRSFPDLKLINETPIGQFWRMSAQRD